MAGQAKNQTSAKITVGNVSLQKGDTKYNVPPNSDSVTTDTQIFSRYEKDRGIFAAGVSSPDGCKGDSVAFFQLFSPVLLWVVDWTSCKAGSKPEVPDPTSKDPNWILLDELWEPSMMTLMPDGHTPLFRLSGTFIYGCKNPKAKTNKDVSFPRPPWIQDVFDRKVEDNLLQQGLSSQQNASQSQSQGNVAAF